MRGRLTGTRIAIVEDDTLLSRSMALFLQVRGARVETYGSAEEAADPVFRGGFDLVVSGYRLQGETGLSFLRRVRETASASGTVLIASRTGKDLSTEASEAGIDSLLPNPFSTKELEEVLARIVRDGGTGDKGIRRVQ